MSHKIIFSKLTDIKNSAQSIDTISSINGIISDNSYLTIKHSDISTNQIQAIKLLNKNSVNIISANITGTIVSNNNNNISNISQYNSQHLMTNESINSIYNFPSVNLQKKRYGEDFNLNTAMFSHQPYISKPVLLSGDTPIFGSFNDSILLEDIVIHITPYNEADIVSITLESVNNISISQLPFKKDDILEVYLKDSNIYSDENCISKLTPQLGKAYIDLFTTKKYKWTGIELVQLDQTIYTNLKTFFNNLPKNLNNHTLTIKLNNLSVNLFKENNYVCEISNLIGGKLNIQLVKDNYISFIFNNCKNINIKNASGQTYQTASIRSLSFIDCKNVQIADIYINGKINEIKPIWMDSNENATIYFKNTNAILNGTKLHSELKTTEIVANQITGYGIAAYNSQIYIKYHNNENPDTFFGYKKNCILYNFSTVDSNRYLNNLQTYIDEITDGEDTSSNRADGLYKHFHTEYIPAPDLVPVGATIGFPRIVNGKSFCKTYAQSSALLPRGMIFTKAMQNTIPSCFIPFDTDLSAQAWRTEYKSKFDELSGTDYEDLVQQIKPFDSATAHMSYNLFFGKPSFPNYAYNTYFSNKSIKNAYIENLNKEYSQNIVILSDISLKLEKGSAYDVEAATNDNGLVCNTYNTIELQNDNYSLSGYLNLLDIRKFYYYTQPSQLRDFQDLILEKSYVSLLIDNTEYKIYFQQLMENTLNDNLKKILKPILIDNTSSPLLSNIPIQFKRSITNITIYYFGIPADANCSDIVGGGDGSNGFYTIKKFQWSNTINKRHINKTNKQISLTTIGDLTVTVILPETPAYYQFYSDTILCFYNNKLDNSTEFDDGGLGDDTYNKYNLFTKRIFRRVTDAYKSTKNYLYVSGLVSSDFVGLYKKQNDNKYVYINQDQIATNHKNYYMTVTAGKYELYNTRDLANNTNNTFIGSFNKIASYMNEDKNFYLHSRAYNNLSELEKVMPSAILDIDHEFQKIPSAYMQTNYLNKIAYGYIPANGYNFDFSRKSVNSMVSGYFRIKQKNKQYIYTSSDTKKILTGKIDGFQTNLNNLYNGLNKLKTYISSPLYIYNTNNTNYQIYPFDAQSSLSTTPYALNEHLIKSNVLFSTINRLADVMLQKHGKLKTDNITNTKKDIRFEDMYPESFYNDAISSRYNQNSTEYVADILDSYGMYWNTSHQLKGGLALSSYHTCIPFIKNSDINNDLIFTLKGTAIPAYPFGWITANDNQDWYPYLTDRRIKAKHAYNTLPYVYNLHTLYIGNETILNYTGIVKIPINAQIQKLTINGVTKNISLLNTPNANEFKKTLTNTRNVIDIEYIVDKITQHSVFIIPYQEYTSISCATLKDLKFAPKYNYIYTYTDSITFKDDKEFARFKIAYKNVIGYACYKLNQIWTKILSKCKNQASFISYSVLYESDTFMYGMQTNNQYSEQIDFNNLKSIPDYTSGVFSIGSTVRYFCTSQIGNYFNNKSNKWFTSNYSLSAIIPQIFNK